MKNFTLLLISGLLSSGLSYAQTDQIYTRSNEKVVISPEKKINQFMKPVNKTTRSSDNSIWRPKTEVCFICDPEDESEEITWYEDNITQYTYDKRGNVTYFEREAVEEEEGEKLSRTFMKYDANNNLIERIEQYEIGGEMVNHQKTEFEYDNIVTNFVTRRTTYDWDEVHSDWGKTYEHLKLITRDKNNNITQILVKLLNYDGVSYIDRERTDIIYDETTGKAKTWINSADDYGDGMQEGIKYDNIVWENTNGQIVETNEQFVLGNNRIKEAKVSKGGKEVGTYKTVFTGEKDFECTINVTQMNRETSQEEYVSNVHTYKILNENGDIREELIYKVDSNQDGQFTNNEIVEQQYMIWKYDDKGNQIISAGFFPIEGNPSTTLAMSPVTPDPGWEQTDGEMTEYTYNEYGEIESRVVYMWNYEPGAGQYLPIEKYVSSDFKDVTTGLQTTSTKSEKLTYAVNKNGEMEFQMEGMNGYTLYSVNGSVIVNGKTDSNTENISIANLPSGLYILKVTGAKGTENVKFMKK
ncbi:T9SS type A sorting domain-containing protein [Bacteroides sp.]